MTSPTRAARSAVCRDRITSRILARGPSPPPQLARAAACVPWRRQ
jgi:hypothetical protein